MLRNNIVKDTTGDFVKKEDKKEDKPKKKAAAKKTKTAKSVKK